MHATADEEISYVKYLPVIKVMEQFVKLASIIPTSCLWNQSMIFLPELAGESSKHGSNSQVILVVAIE